MCLEPGETGISLGRLGERAGYASGSMAIISSLGTLLELELEPGRCVVVMCIGKSNRACLCYKDNTVFLSLQHVLDLFHELGLPKSFLVGAA